MKGDYHRYLAEFATGNTRSTSSEASLEACASLSTLPVLRSWAYFQRTRADAASLSIQTRPLPRLRPPSFPLRVRPNLISQSLSLG